MPRITQTTNQAIALKGAILDMRISARTNANTRPTTNETSISGTEINRPALNMGQKESTSN